MFKIKVISTGSVGNSYLLSDEAGETLILDAGVRAADIKKALDYDFSKVSGVLISHTHKDHSLSADDLLLYGLDVWKPYMIEGGKDRRTFGKYAVQSFDVPHGDYACCGFYIRHMNGFKMLYLTDLEYCKYNFRKQEVNTILIECNWQKEYVNTEAHNYQHKVLDHMSFDACKGFVEANVTDKLRSVVLCHQSNFTCDINECVRGIQEIVTDNVNVDFAEKGKEIKLI